jgi:hypothetical protein
MHSNTLNLHKIKTHMKRLLMVVLLALGCQTAVLAQGCSVCTKTAQGLDDNSAKGLNKGIVYLAFLPLGIMGTLGYVWYRYNRTT